jgi:3-hydroxyacyl-[acyl-carrier-protein] dehydratase
MRFVFLDRILSLEPGKRIKAVKTLSPEEEYLEDHFPLFPVMPGVLVLEAIAQAGAWLVRLSEDFAHSLITIKGVRNIRYAGFVSPGDMLTISVELKGLSNTEADCKISGVVNDRIVVAGRMTLGLSNWADHHPAETRLDQRIRERLRRELSKIYAANVPCSTA